MRLALVLCAVLTLVALGTAGRSTHEGAAGSWRELPPAPLAARADHAAVWTGHEMVVWGGDSGARSYADGAAYDPERNRWRRLAPAPLEPRSRATAVWTGSEMIVWGGGAGGGTSRFGDGAAYDAARDRWRRLAKSPLTTRFGHTAVWTGRLMIVFGGFTECGLTWCESGEAASYDPTRDRWRYLNFWHGRWGHTAVWTGREVIVWGGDGSQEYERNGASYRPSNDVWRALPSGPLEGRVGHSAVWTGKEMLVLGGASNRELAVEGAAYDPARRRWRTLPHSPGWPSWSQAVWTARRVLVWGRAGGSAYAPATNRWERLPAAPLARRSEHSAIWTGRELIVWGGESCTDSCHRADGAAYRPSQSSTQRISGFGIAATLPNGWRGRVKRGTLLATTAALPPERGWLSSELGRNLGHGDVGVLLFEIEPAHGIPIEPSVYRRGPPRPFRASEFAGSGRQRFARRNFSVAGRLFDLFIEARDRVPTPRALRRLNALVRSLEIERGDFYPGSVGAARFPPAPGWSTRSTGALPFRPVSVSTTVSATIAYRDAFSALPPQQTLKALPPDGIALRVALVADNRRVPMADRRENRELARRPYRLADASCGSFEGFPESQLACVLRAVVPREYRVEVWVMYGRRYPTREQRARAQAQLDRLVLPSWPRWP
jgi:N-acetylneuraminic acid mutarotase